MTSIARMRASPMVVLAIAGVLGGCVDASAPARPPALAGPAVAAAVPTAVPTPSPRADNVGAALIRMALESGGLVGPYRVVEITLGDFTDLLGLPDDAVSGLTDGDRRSLDRRVWRVTIVGTQASGDPVVLQVYIEDRTAKLIVLRVRPAPADLLPIAPQ